MGPRAVLDRCGKSRPPPGFDAPDHPVRSKSLRNAIKIITNGYELQKRGGGVVVQKNWTLRRRNLQVEKIAKSESSQIYS